MRTSRLLLQTLREAPGEVKLPGHQLLLRAGLVRSLYQGSYGFLPLGVRTRHKIAVLLRDALAVVGGQEVALPSVQPAELWSGADEQDKPGGRGVRFRDRGQREMALSSSHEAAVLAAVRGVVQSYRQLPVLLYQFWQQFHDEDRVAGGLFGAREECVVDGYSLHADTADLNDFCPRVQNALADVLGRCGLETLTAAAALNGHGAVTAHKVAFALEAGEERIVQCRACGYAATQAVARAAKEPPPAEALLPMEDVETPNCKTIADLAHFLNVPESRTVKALFMIAGFDRGEDRFVFALVRGDTDLNESKLCRVLNARTVGPATEAEIRAAGAEPGYGSPVGLQEATVVVDDLVARSPNLVAGANRPGYHTRNVNVGRDYQATIIADITLARKGDRCPECPAPLSVTPGVELATLAKAGDGYGRALNVTYLDREGRMQPVVLGRYRLYVDRVIAAVAESHHDAQGIIWPPAVAPYHVYLMTVGKASAEVSGAADRGYAELVRAGIDVLYDDRDERAGVKFNDADLLGMPLRVAVGERGIKNGVVELKRRGESEVENIPLEELVARVASLL